HTSCSRDWSSDVCSSDLKLEQLRSAEAQPEPQPEPGAALWVSVTGPRRGVRRIGREFTAEPVTLSVTEDELDALKADHRLTIARSEERRVGKEGCRDW